MSKWSLAAVLAGISVEPAIFLHGLAESAAESVHVSLKVDKVCRTGSVWFGNGNHYSASVCDGLDNGSFPLEQNQVQQAANRLTIAETYVMFVPAVFYVVMAAAWADKHGRKRVMLYSQLGELLSMLYILLNLVFYREMRSDWLVLQGLKGLGGFSPVFFAMTTAMITDVAPAKWLALRITFAQHLNRHIGQVIGANVASHIYKSHGFQGAYVLSAFFYAIVVIYIMLFIKETKPSKSSSQTELPDLCNPRQVLQRMSQLIKESLSLIFKKRTGNGKTVIVTTLIGFSLFINGRGAFPINVYYFKKSFVWATADEFNAWFPKFVAVNAWCQMLDTPAMFLFNSHLHDKGEVVAMLAAASALAMDVNFLTATTPESLYWGLGMGFLNQLGFIGVRVLLISVVTSEEVARSQGLVAMTGTSSFLVQPAYDLLYNATLHWRPGFVYFVAACFNALTIAVFGVIYLLKKSNRNNSGEVKYAQIT